MSCRSLPRADTRTVAAACSCTPDPIAFSAVLHAEDRPLHGRRPADAPTPRDGDDEIARLAALRTRLHARQLSAICLSGGGIRSASVSLGVVQALARLGILGQFDYLSTVSGGGYTGGWLTRWRY